LLRLDPTHENRRQPSFLLVGNCKNLSQKSRLLIVDLQAFSHFFALKETQTATEMSGFHRLLEEDAAK
jgi:hypothetical protein